MFLGRLIKPVLTFTQRNNSFSRFSAADSLKMADNCCGKKLSEILKGLESFAPLEYAEKWDNVGLLIDPMNDENTHKINDILLTNDLTEDVLNEAIGLKCGLIITYHPNIFQGMKSLTSKTWKERIVVQCLRNNIAVFSPHTSWDATIGGVNDWLAKIFPYVSSTPILPNEKDLTKKIGCGRFLILKHPIKLSDAIENVKKHINLPFVRLALARNKDKDSVLINKVALCAGSGSSVLRDQKDVDLYLTGEMLHHDVLEATQNGIHVILCNHSDSERGFLKEFQEKLQKDILENCVNVHVSKLDKDPLETV